MLRVNLTDPLIASRQIQKHFGNDAGLALQMAQYYRDLAADGQTADQCGYCNDPDHWEEIIKQMQPVYENGVEFRVIAEFPVADVPGEDIYTGLEGMARGIATEPVNPPPHPKLPHHRSRDLRKAVRRKARTIALSDEEFDTVMVMVHKLRAENDAKAIKGKRKGND